MALFIKFKMAAITYYSVFRRNIVANNSNIWREYDIINEILYKAFE